jgi:hypothetical protein
MGNLISDIKNSTHGITTIVMWPSAVMNDISSKKFIEAAGGMAVGGGAAYYFFGNPVEIVRKFASAPGEEFIDAAFFYGTVGVGYWATSELVASMKKNQS